jgi:hypothetical protein
MTTPSNEIYPDSEEVRGPKAAKGGTFAPADVDLIKKLIIAYVADSSMTLSPQEEQQAINLLHRLGRIA